MSYLRVANIKKTYHVTREEFQEVLKGVTCEFKRGELYAILGESGCGKSTLMNILGGLDFDYTGSVVIDDVFISEYTEAQLDDYRKKMVGFIFQSHNLITHMSVIENVIIAMTMSNTPAKERKERAKELLKEVGLSEEHHNKMINQLSGGQKQRVAIARALANDPNIILADEPTGSLDPDSSEDIFELLRDIAMTGKLVIIVTHSERIAAKCSYIVRLEHGVVAETVKLSPLEKKTPKLKNIKPQSIDIKKIWQLAFNNLMSNLQRTILVILAMSIGIASVSFMFSLGSGIKEFINVEMASTVDTLRIDVIKDANGLESFTTSEIKNIKNSIDGVDKVIESTAINLSAAYKNSSMASSRTFLTLFATFEGFEIDLKHGELPKEGEILVSTSTAYYLAGKLNNSSGIIGGTMTITLENITHTFTISGIMDDSSAYDYAYISPEDMKIFYPSGSLPTNRLYVFATDMSYVTAITDSLNILGYTADRQDTSIEELLSYVDMGTVILGLVAAISLVVSAIMIFIVINISVVERIKEIGILRSIGARQRDVRRIFIFESAIIGAISGLIGCILSLIIGLIVNSAIASDYSTGVVDNNVLIYLAALAISVAITVVSGLSPAASAAGADPIECLRQE